MLLLCWNVNGIRAVHRKGLFLPFIRTYNPDVLCLQETKAQPEQLSDEILKIDGYESHFHSAQKKGYSSVAIYTRTKPVSVTPGCGIERYDIEGRVISVEFKELVLYNIYFPNGGRGPERLAYKMDFYADLLAQWEALRKQGKRIVVCGDVNTAHKEIDVAKPKEWSDDSGFLPQERAWLDKLFGMGYIDTFRMVNNEPEQYTFWDPITRARIRNEGWRIDYFIVTEDLKSHVRNASILAGVDGSDHCPIGLELGL
jgi:exodeoxyribonuclease-3